MKEKVFSHFSRYWHGFLVASLFLSPILTWASSHGDTGSTPGGDTGSTPGGGGGLQNPLAFNSLAEFLDALLKVIIQIGWPVVVLAVIWTGFLFVKAQGDPNELSTAKRAFMWTVVGALVVLGATAIAAFVEGTVGEISG